MLPPGSPAIQSSKHTRGDSKMKDSEVHEDGVTLLEDRVKLKKRSKTHPFLEMNALSCGHPVP